MGRASVEKAFETTGFSDHTFTFNWNADSTVLKVTPAEPLQYAEGDLLTESRHYAFSLSGEVLAGNGLILDETVSVSFSTLRRIVATLRTGYDANNLDSEVLNGTITASGLFKPCSEYDLWVGEFAPESSELDARAVITFDSRELAPNITLVESATLEMTRYASGGTPFGENSLGAIALEQIVTPVPIAGSAFDVAPGGKIGDFSISPSVGPRSISVREVVDLALEDRASNNDHVQFRLQFSGIANGGSADYTWFECAGNDRPQLDITYLAP